MEEMLVNSIFFHIPMSLSTLWKKNDPTKKKKIWEMQKMLVNSIFFYIPMSLSTLWKTASTIWDTINLFSANVLDLLKSNILLWAKEKPFL